MKTFRIIDPRRGVDEDNSREHYGVDAEHALDGYLGHSDFPDGYPDGDEITVVDHEGGLAVFEVTTDFSPTFNLHRRRAAA